MGKCRPSGDRRPQGSLVMIMNSQEESAMNFNEAALKLHEEHHGKIEVTSKVPVKTRDDLSTAYTPVLRSHAERSMIIRKMFTSTLQRAIW